MTTVQIQLPTVFPYQHEALFGDERYAVVEGSTKAGKTYPCIIWLLSEVGRRGGPNRHFWWIAPTHDQAEIAYKRLKAMLLQADPDGATWTTNDTKKRIGLGQLGEVEFKSGEEPDNLYGDDVYAAVLDEYTRMREEAWHAIRSTLTATGGKCRLIGNVKGRKNWGYKLARKAQEPGSGMRYSKFTAADAVREGLIPQSEVDDAEKTLPHAVFRELYFAEPSDDGSNPFGTTHIEACIRPLSSLSPVCYGIDLARKHDYTVVVGLDENGHVCRFERWNGMSWDATVNRIVGTINGCPALADSTGVGDPVVEQIQRRCPRVDGFQFTSRSKQQLMEGLAVSIQTGAIGFPDNEIVRELSNFEYVPTRTGVTYSAFDGMHDDCVMALALAARIMVTNAVVPQFYVGVASGSLRKKGPGW